MPHKLLLVKHHIGHKVIFAATLSYLLGVRILSVSSISHLFHAIERQSQTDKKQQAANERRHHAQRQPRASLSESEATVWLHPTPAGSFLVRRRAEREGRSQSTCRKRTPRRRRKKKGKELKKKKKQRQSIPVVFMCAAVIQPDCVKNPQVLWQFLLLLQC